MHNQRAASHSTVRQWWQCRTESDPSG